VGFYIVLLHQAADFFNIFPEKNETKYKKVTDNFRERKRAATGAKKFKHIREF
jgi:hypothetical protein